MSKKELTKEDYAQAGWGLAIVLAALGWLVSVVLVFFGAQWWWPWLFLGIFIGVTARVIPNGRVRKAEKTVGDHKHSREPRMPHLTTIPGQYTRKPCTNPSWIQIPFRREYEINCFSHVVRERATRDIVEPGYDPEGLGDGVWFNLGVKDGRNVYTKLEDIVEATFGRGHGC